MSAKIPVNHRVLQWARESIGLSLARVASHFGKPVSEIEAWESGDDAPTYVQLEKLAYEVYKRPLAIFFFPDPPEEESIEESFRTLPEIELQRIPARLRLLLRKAKVLQLNLSELYRGINPSNAHILRGFDFNPRASAQNMAHDIRVYLGIDVQTQNAWGSADEALRRWRNLLEDHGLFIFKDSFRHPGRRRDESNEAAFSGFCIYDDEFPVIYINNNKSKTRQVFTLFHELAHLLMHTGGVDTRLDDYIDYLQGDNRRIEILCNQFAGEFLVPSDDFERRTRRTIIDQESIAALAEFYCVSREVILRKFLDQNKVSSEDYEETVARWAGESFSNAGSGGDYYRNKGTYLGRKYIEQVLTQYQRREISIEEAADYLDEKVRNLSGIEDWFLSREAQS
jgi:Zn-dependent peptidase ImmA (M78 family)